MVRKVKEVGPPRKFNSGAATEMSCETPGGSNVHVAEVSIAFCTLMIEVVLVGRALGHPLRVHILSTIGSARMSVKDVARSCSIPHALCSYHLSVLYDARLVTFRRVGRRHVYRRTDEPLQRVFGLEPS